MNLPFSLYLYISRCHDAPIRSCTPSDVLYHLAGHGSCPGLFTDPTQTQLASLHAISLCQIHKPASANHSSDSQTHRRRHDPSPRIHRAALPRLIVPRAECEKDLTSPGRPLAAGT